MAWSILTIPDWQKNDAGWWYLQDGKVNFNYNGAVRMKMVSGMCRAATSNSIITVMHTAIILAAAVHNKEAM